MKPSGDFDSMVSFSRTTEYTGLPSIEVMSTVSCLSGLFTVAAPDTSGNSAAATYNRHFVMVNYLNIYMSKIT